MKNIVIGGRLWPGCGLLLLLLCMAGAARASATPAADSPAAGLRAGARHPVLLTLRHRDSAFPVLLQELAAPGAAAIDIYALDRRQGDFHHLRPLAKNAPGQYAFFLTPGTACSYRLWVDVHFRDGRRSRTSAIIPGQHACALPAIVPDHTPTASAGPYSFTFRSTTPPRAGRPFTLNVHIEKPQDMNEAPDFPFLEPYAGHFALLAGFYRDGESMLAARPEGEPPGGRHDRGGPAVAFTVMPERAGPWQFFLRVKIGGTVLTVPYAVNVMP